jgi:hypothetical protein
MSLVIDIRGVRTRNQLNTRRHWRTDAAERKTIRQAVEYALIGADWTGYPKPSEDDPWDVTLTRSGPGELDPDDGLPSACKSVRDAFAAFVGVDDKHRRVIRYRYEQVRSREYGVRIEVTRRQMKLEVVA